MSDLNALVAHVFTDTKFIRNLVDNPRAALRGADIEPTAEILEVLRDLDVAAVSNLAAAFRSDCAA